MWIKILLSFFLIFPTFAKDISRSMLLKGCPIPEKRDFPVNSSISPCQDFHQYACSSVEDSFKLPEDRSSWSFSFTDNAERLLYVKKNYFKLIEKGYTPKSPRAKQLKTFYTACMNVPSAKKEEFQVINSERDLILSLKSHQEFQQLSEARIDQAESSFIKFHPLANQNDPNQFDVLMISKMMNLPERSYYEKPEVIKDFEQLLVSFFQTLKIDQPHERAKWVISFEKEMSQKYPLPAEIRPRIALDTYMEKEDFIKKYPHLLLNRFLARIPDQVKIRNLVPESMEFFNHALVTYPLEQLKSAYLFYSLHNQMDDAFPQFFKEKFDFDHKHLGGPLKRPVRQERCTRIVMDQFPMELDEELIPILFPDFPQDKVIASVSKVRDSLLEGLKNNLWLSDSARKEAILKVKKAQLFLVKPQTEKEWDFNPLATYSKNLPYQNKKILTKLNIEKEIQELSAKRIRERWSMGPLSLNAYYSPPDNKFVLLQGILQYPFFDHASMSEIENLAAIGTVVGHELGHGIDDQGSRYDSDGLLRQWMKSKDLLEFEKRGSKFIERFDQIGHNGKLTLGENIGDHVGLTSSYRAAFPDSNHHNHYNYHIEQKKQFFLSYARIWCSVMRPQMKEKRLKTDPHALGYARINEQVIHLDGFYEAYSCKSGDKMFISPEERIKIW